jgi:hypothetical protein
MDGGDRRGSKARRPHIKLHLGTSSNQTRFLGGRSFSPHFPKKSETKNLKIGNIENGYTSKREGKGKGHL